MQHNRSMTSLKDSKSLPQLRIQTNESKTSFKKNKDLDFNQKFRKKPMMNKVSRRLNNLQDPSHIIVDSGPEPLAVGGQMTSLTKDTGYESNFTKSLKENGSPVLTNKKNALNKKIPDKFSLPALRNNDIQNLKFKGKKESFWRNSDYLSPKSRAANLIKAKKQGSVDLGGIYEDQGTKKLGTSKSTALIGNFDKHQKINLLRENLDIDTSNEF